MRMPRLTILSGEQNIQPAGAPSSQRRSEVPAIFLSLLLVIDVWAS